MSTKTICVDNALFQKLAKKLNNDEALQTTQENLAKAFGFRNLHALQQFFKTSPKELEKSHSLLASNSTFAHRFATLNTKQRLKLCSALIPKTNKQGNEFTTQIFDIYLELCLIEKKTISADTLRSLLDFYNIFSLTDVYHPDLKLKDTNLPKYLVDKINDYKRALIDADGGHGAYAADTHRKALEPFHHILHGFELLEKHDPLLFSIDWMNWYDTNQAITDNLDVRKKYSNTNPAVWREQLNGWAENSWKDRTPLVTWQDRIRFHDVIDDTWLNYPLFIKLIVAKFKNCTIDKIYLSDLLFDYADVANPVKEEYLAENIRYFFNNFEQTLKLSQSLQHA